MSNKENLEYLFDELELSNIKIEYLIKLIALNKEKEVIEIIKEVFDDKEDISLIIESLKEYLNKSKEIEIYSKEELVKDLEEKNYLLVLANIFGNIEKVFITKNLENVLIVLYENNAYDLNIVKQFWKIKE